jgi:beta-lactamase superfamily II metal-dependent hydrolase
MSVIKSYSVGNGDMFTIDHNTDSFTIIDCCLSEDNADRILNEVAERSRKKGITRFISTHPDDDHMRGLELLDDKIGIANFYCVQNKATKEEMTDSFRRYCALRDSDKAYFIMQGCKRKWLNESDETRKGAGITFLWPRPDHSEHCQILDQCGDGGSPNNISPIIQYSVNEGVTALWMGDLEAAFMEKIADDVDLPKVDLLFAPHHGRESGKIPPAMLEKMSPELIIIGEAPSEFLNYYSGYNTITQNSAGDIIFDCDGDGIHIFSSNDYSVDCLKNKWKSLNGHYYIGTLEFGEGVRGATAVTV